MRHFHLRGWCRRHILVAAVPSEVRNCYQNLAESYLSRVVRFPLACRKHAGVKMFIGPYLVDLSSPLSACFAVELLLKLPRKHKLSYYQNGFNNKYVDATQLVRAYQHIVITSVHRSPTFSSLNFGVYFCCFAQSIFFIVHATRQYQAGGLSSWSDHSPLLSWVENRQKIQHRPSSLYGALLIFLTLFILKFFSLHPGGKISSSHPGVN